ncbi:MAG TPA: hypothetical protein VFX43_17735 [Chitinophagaceae bacterium]|nr:hypothetical protein [Chitinophagaceae bacterium]
MFGKSAISVELFDKIAEILPRGKSILEFGSGEGTRELIKNWKVISVEHNEKYVIPGHQTVKAAIDSVTGWYHKERVKTALNLGPYGLIIIDGPPGNKRGNFQFELFDDVDCPVIFDDVNRWIDRSIMQVFCRKFDYTYDIFEGQEKDFALCTKN